jgi:hypothetical protein
MTIRLQITIQDEGLLDSGTLVLLIDRVDRACRNAAVITIIRIANDFDLPVGLVQLVSLRIWTREESFFWIEEVRSGSKKLIGRIFAGALITTALNNTIGESIKEGWRRTDTHAYVSTSIPKIEEFFVEEFRRLLDDDHQPADGRLDVDPVVIKPDESGFSLEIRARQKRTKPTTE